MEKLVTFFGAVITITSLKWHLNVQFCHKQFEKTQFRQITQLQVIKIEALGRWGRRVPDAWRFLKICY